jgi:tetratricopeptide (TPR) repeat protein
MTQNRNKGWLLGVCLGLAAATVAAYWPVFWGEFIHFDDPEYVFENEWVKQGLTVEGVRWAFTTGHAGNWHPVTWLAHMLDVSLFGLKPAGHHATNLILHTLNSLLVLGLLIQLTGKRWQSLVVAAVFALHPIHVESVAWVSERKDVLSTFFGLLTLLAYARYAECKIKNEKGKNTYYGVALLCFALGLMSKPMLVTWPFVMLLIDFWPLQRVPSAECRMWNGWGKEWARLVREKIPFFALVAVSCVVTYLVQQKQGAVASTGLPIESRLANAGLSYYLYVQKILWPMKLAFFYPHPATLYPELKDWITPKVFLAILGVAGMCGLAAWQRRQRPYLTFGWFCFLGTLVPTIGIVQVGSQAMADRYAYFPMLGIVVILVWSGAMIGTRWGVGQKALAGMVSVLLLGLGYLCQAQAARWKNDEAVFGQALAVTEKNATAHLNYGSALDLRGKPDEAITHYRKAIEFDPYLEEAHFNLGRLLVGQGKMREAEAPYREAIRLKPSHAMAHNNLGTVLESAGQWEAALEHYETARRLQPGQPQALLNLGRLRAAQGNYAEAINHYTKALQTDNTLADAETGLGLALLMQQKFEEALQHLRRAIVLKPDSPEAHYHCAIALTITGKAGEARSHFEKAIQLRPDWLPALNEYAWMLAAHPQAEIRNGTEAVRLAEKAREISGGKEARIWGTLDAAYAEAGRFPEAIAAAAQTIKLAQAAGQPELVTAAQQRLLLYQQSKPYHQGN